MDCGCVSLSTHLHDFILSFCRIAENFSQNTRYIVHPINKLSEISVAISIYM